MLDSGSDGESEFREWLTESFEDSNLSTETLQNLTLGLAWSNQEFPAHSRIESKDIGTIVGNFFIVGMKTEGVEPGYFAVWIDKKFFERFNNDETIKKQFNNLPISSIEQLKLFLPKKNSYSLKINALKTFAEKLCKEGKDIEHNIDEPKLDLQLIKGDYEKGMLDTVKPPQESLQNSNTIQLLPSWAQNAALFSFQQGKTISRRKQNLYTLLEIIASDLARCSMKTHEMYWVPSLYLDKTLRFMMASKWEARMRKLQGRLAGSLPGKFENFFVITSEKETTLQADPNGSKFAIHLAEIISEGDPDAINIGSNKGTIEEDKEAKTIESYDEIDEIESKDIEFFGFDFGHAHRKRNSFVDTLEPDFYFKELYSTCKNFSLFYDAPLSQMYKGMFFIFKTLSTDKINDLFTPAEIERVNLAISAYAEIDEQFKQQYETIPLGALDRIFSKYIMTFTSLAEKTENSDLKKEYSFYAEKIGESYKFAREARVAMLQVCKEYMQLTPVEVDFLDNLRKLTSNTSPLSSDGKVLLNHLRVLPERKILWKMHKNIEENTVFVTTIIESTRKRNILFDYLNNNKSLGIKFRIDNDNNIVQLIFPMAKMNNIAKFFNEENIRQFKHPEINVLRDNESYMTSYREDDSEKELAEREATFEKDEKEKEKKSTFPVEQCNKAQKREQTLFSFFTGAVETMNSFLAPPQTHRNSSPLPKSHADPSPVAPRRGHSLPATIGPVKFFDAASTEKPRKNSDLENKSDKNSLKKDGTAETPSPDGSFSHN
jgi:hypothetical protein